MTEITVFEFAALIWACLGVYAFAAFVEFSIKIRRCLRIAKGAVEEFRKKAGEDHDKEE